MMLWLSAVVIAAVSNLDNLTAGVAFGMRDTRIAAAPNAVIAAVTMAATAGAMTSGRALSHVLPPSLAAALGFDHQRDRRLDNPCIAPRATDASQRG